MQKYLSMKIVYFLAAAALLFGGLLVFSLLESPFGMIFWSGAFLLFAGFSGLLGLLSMRLLKHRRIFGKIAGVILLLSAVLVLATFMLLKIDYRILIQKSFPGKLTAEEWRSDLEFLQGALRARHPAPFSLISEQRFEDAFESTKLQIEDLTEQQSIVEVMRLVAMLNDGHTSVMPIPGRDLHFLPLKVYWFDDGLFIVDASREHKDIIGTQIVGIGEFSIEEVFERFTTILGAENDLHKKYRFQFWAMATELLNGLNISLSEKSVRVRLKTATGEIQEVDISAESALNWTYWSLFKRVDDEPSPAVSNFRSRKQIVEYLDEPKMVYARINAIENESRKDTFHDFVKRVEAMISERQVDKLVIDLRNCLGGNAVLAQPLLELLSHSEKINQRGRLFVLIGRKTYSAAVNLSTMLETRTPVIFVGEATGQGPNQFGDHLPVQLPHSKIDVMISSRLWQFSLAEDKRDWIEPDLPVLYHYSDFANDRDPAMQAIISYRTESPKKNISDRDLAGLSGDYQLSPFLRLTISEEHGGRMTVYFLESEPPVVASRLYLSDSDLFWTDIRDVYLAVDRKNVISKVALLWKGSEIVLNRTADEKLPLDRLSEGRIESASKTFQEFADNKNVLPSNIELSINNIGYRFLRHEQFDQAVNIFKLNVNLFPNSANTYDSLGEAYLAAGDREGALKNYRRALALDRRNHHAAEVVKTLVSN